MTPIAQQALDNAWARAHELGLPSILGRCLKAGMPIGKAREVVEACDGKRQPHVFCSACINRWRAQE